MVIFTLPLTFILNQALITVPKDYKVDSFFLGEILHAFIFYISFKWRFKNV
ncbi:hypothetical protein JOD45_002429 [Scopulibacillus daqui]|uniref:Uncharacterized protein n=1 Tax=Scopulibacillus daqui TaxID=1469162 RepID=A0ABS2Q1Q9_9BACL|nr:hypothetical protein [Scopulibacillus daqui]